MTVMVPDLVLICENMLMAEGFIEAKVHVLVLSSDCGCTLWHFTAVAKSFTLAVGRGKFIFPIKRVIGCLDWTSPLCSTRLTPIALAMISGSCIQVLRALFSSARAPLQANAL